MRNLVLILGDQLSHHLSAFDDFDNDRDGVWMAEADEEATYAWSHRLRLVLFFSAMRHFREALRERGRTVDYHSLTHRPSEDRGKDLPELLRKAVHRRRPARLVLTEPGDARVWASLRRAAENLEIPLEVREDRHFYCSQEAFREWSGGRQVRRLEDFYRAMRKSTGILMEDAKKPVGDAWNFDKQNRGSFGQKGPGTVKAPRSFRTDAITDEVIAMVQKRFSKHPGSLENFDYPVNHDQARAALRDFIRHRLPRFGDYQDAMWTGRVYLYHSRLSSSLNLHLLDPREVIETAVEAYHAGQAPLNAVEGFVRQILGWREFIRGIYWQEMPDYIERNALQCGDRDVPDSFWTGETEMNCIRQSMQGVLQHGYAHHIQRLMVLGLTAQLWGVHPRLFHEWHMAMYVDAIDWVSLPNTLGMSQFGDGGIVGTKPYCASGNYIDRMSDYCRGCRFHPKEATGENACPVTTLYWDFLDRHASRFRDNRRMVFQIKHLEKKQDALPEIRRRAARLKERLP